MPWQLDPPKSTETWPVCGRLVWTNTVPYTVFGDDSGLQLSLNGDKLIEYPGPKYLWIGGHVNTTDDPAIRDLWLANGLGVIDLSTITYPDVSQYPSPSLYPKAG